jgi:hypothetical protein
VIAPYNIADVIALRAIYEKVRNYDDSVYPVHCAINRRGVRFDRGLASEIIRISNEHTERAGHEVERLTGGYITPADLRRRDYVLKWVKRQGVNLLNLRRDSVQLLLDDPEAFYEAILEDDYDDEVQQTPEIPSEAGADGAVRGV